MQSHAVLDDILYPVVDEMRATLPNADAFVKSPATKLFGSGAALDSLGLVSFIMAVEERIQVVTGEQIRLVTEKAMSRSHSPFRTIETLGSYINELLPEVQAK